MDVVEKSVLDEMILARRVKQEQMAAKLLPGTLPVRFEAAGNVIDTVPIKSTAARTITSCWDQTDGGQAPLGTRDFVVIMHCPSLTIFHGPGGPGYIPVTSKLGGFAMLQTDAVGSNLSVSLFQ